MRLMKIRDIQYNTDLIIELDKKKEFLEMCGEGNKDDDGDKIEAIVFSDGNSYYGFGEGVTYIYRGGW